MRLVQFLAECLGITHTPHRLRFCLRGRQPVARRKILSLIFQMCRKLRANLVVIQAETHLAQDSVQKNFPCHHFPPMFPRRSAIRLYAREHMLHRRLKRLPLFPFLCKLRLAEPGQRIILAFTPDLGPFFVRTHPALTL